MHFHMATAFLRRGQQLHNHLALTLRSSQQSHRYFDFNAEGVANGMLKLHPHADMSCSHKSILKFILDLVVCLFSPQVEGLPHYSCSVF